MPSSWFKKNRKSKAKPEECNIIEADLQNCALEELPRELYQHARTLQTVRLNSNSLTSLPIEFYNLWNVKLLEMFDNDLERLAPEIGELKHLAHLDISRNLLMELPLELEHCPELVYVNFSSNPLSVFPDELTRLYSLRHLGLSDCCLEQLPRHFGRMSKLECLELRENNLSDLPETMSHMTLLETLDIGCNQFERLPPIVTTLVNVEELWVDMNALCSIPKGICHLQHLRVLDLSENRLLELPETIGDLQQLTDLYLADNCLTFLPEAIGKLTNLCSLRCERNKLMILPQGIGGLVSLTELNVSSNNLKMLPPTMGYLKQLATFIADDNILDFVPPELGSCSNLSILSVHGNQIGSLPRELSHLSKLSVLNIIGNRVQHLPFSMSVLGNLKALWISGTQSKPLIELQVDKDVKGNRILTCVYFPQRDSDRPHSSAVKTAENAAAQRPQLAFERKSSINFEITEEPAAKPKEALPYPKEPHVNMVKRMSRDLSSAMSDISLTMSQSQTQLSYMDYPIAPSPAPSKIVAQVMRMQHREKKQLTLVRKNSLLKAADSDSSSISSGSFEELQKLATVDEASERSSSAHGTTPSTQIHVSKLTHSPHGSVSSGRVKTGSSSASKRSEKFGDDELDELLRTLEEETGVMESAESQVFALKPPVASSIGTQDRLLQSILQDAPVSSDESPSSTPTKLLEHESVISYDQSPRVFRRQRCGSVPSMVAPEVFEMGDSDYSHVWEEKRWTKNPAHKRRVSESGNVHNHLRVTDDDGFASSASTSRIDAWVQEQNKLNTRSKQNSKKRSLDDSSLVTSSRGASLRGTQESLAASSTTLVGGKSPVLNKPVTSPSSVAARRQMFEVATPPKPFFSPPQVKHNGSALPSDSPFSSISHSSTDNSLAGAEKGFRSPPSTARHKDTKHRPTSNLSRDSGYTSREYMGLDGTQLPTGLKGKGLVIPGVRHVDFRYSPTEPITSSSAGRRAEFLPQPADVQPSSGRLPHSRSFGPGQFNAEAGSANPNQDLESSGDQPESRPSSAGSIHLPTVPPMHLDYARNGHSYHRAHQMQPRRDKQPPMHVSHPPVFPYPSHMPSSTRNHGYPSPAQHHLHQYHHYYHQQQQQMQMQQQQVIDYYRQQQKYFNTVSRQKAHKPSASSFVDQLNQMSHKNSAKSAPLMDSRESKLSHAYSGREFPGASTVGVDTKRQAHPVYTNRWRTNMHEDSYNAYSPAHSSSDGGNRHRPPPLVPTRNVIEAVINRSSALSALGITITGGMNSPNLYRPRDTGLYIMKLTERGAARQNGTLLTGDRILAVNGVDVTGFSQDQAAALLKQPLTQVRIVVSRQVTSETLI